MAQATKSDSQIFSEIAVKIIESQESIIGPIALQQAKKVSGLSLDWSHKKVDIKSNSPKVIDSLVNQYKVLFGDMAVETCRDVSRQLVSQLPANERPQTLNI
ncbi:hypothetical protein EBZ57_03010 [bacterium]|nr:hypothetical protein [bacterium]